ncbi:MAG: hypothetical protein AAGG45_01560 [Pseudomonadota bacterium]
MSEKAELICRMMVELGAEFERLADEATKQQRPELLDPEKIDEIAIACEDARLIANAAKALVIRADVNLPIE